MAASCQPFAGPSPAPTFAVPFIWSAPLSPGRSSKTQLFTTTYTHLPSPPSGCYDFPARRFVFSIIVAIAAWKMPPPIPAPVDVGDSQLAPNKDGNTKHVANGTYGNSESQPLPIAKRSTTRLSRISTQQLQNGKDREAKNVSVRTLSSTPPAAATLDPLSNVSL